MPDGNGVVSPKWAEALLLSTIPIVPPLLYYVKLQKMGYPFVIIHHWREITQENMKVWWEELSPRLESATWLHTDRCWFDLLASKELSIENTLKRCVPKVNVCV